MDLFFYGTSIKIHSLIAFIIPTHLYNPTQMLDLFLSVIYFSQLPIFSFLSLKFKTGLLFVFFFLPPRHLYTLL